MMNNWHLFTPDTASKYLKVSLDEGLSEVDVEERQMKYMKNELPAEKGTSFYELLVEQFNDNLVRILLLAAFISAILGFMEPSDSKLESFVEPAVIVIVLIVNGFISATQSRNADEAIEALKEYEPELAKVLRKPSKQFSVIKARELVPGDIVQVSSGDKVPADIRLCKINSTCFIVDQSILTGESLGVSKITEAIDIHNPVNIEKTNIIFSGTNVSSGNAIGIVIATGLSTEIGKIRNEIISDESSKTPLQVKLDEFGNQLSKLISIICAIVWIINIGHFNDPIHGGSWIKGAIYYFKIAIALAVAAIPEGLPAVITTCLALGTRRMAKKNAIVRSLPSVETLGCTTVICSDKTGTLTTNQMCVSEVITLDASSTSLEEFHISGSSFEPIGMITKNDKQINSNQYPILKDVGKICVMCNQSSLTYNESKNVFNRIGEATEAALCCLAEKLNLNNVDRAKLPKSSLVNSTSRFIQEQFETIVTLDFTRDRKSMSVLCKEIFSSKLFLFVKGAPESIIERCTTIMNGSNKIIPMTDALKELITIKFNKMADDDALRCIALAISNSPINFKDMNLSDPNNFINYEQDLCFCGLVGMKDPPRESVKGAIQACKVAGIRTIMITGDNKNTAVSIAKSIGLFSSTDNADEYAITAREFDELTYEKKVHACNNMRVFSRVDPTHKSTIIEFLQKANQITAMTGDGVNDAPALKKAEIGIAMGSGTSVAKSASDMVLADDNFSTIVAAIEEGRIIYVNTKQFIRYLVSSNIGEVVSIFLTSLLGFPEGLIPVQLLWVNLITDGLPATALGFNPPDSDVMLHRPRNPKESIINRSQLFRYVIVGMYVGIATVMANGYWFMYDQTGPKLSFYQLSNYKLCSSTNPMFKDINCDIFADTRPMTMSLSVLVVAEMFNAFNSVSEYQSILTTPPWKNPFLVFAVLSSMIIHFFTLHFSFTQIIFSVTSLSSQQWVVVILMSIPIIFIDEIFKFFGRINLSKALVDSGLSKQKVD